MKDGVLRCFIRFSSLAFVKQEFYCMSTTAEILEVIRGQFLAFSLFFSSPLFFPSFSQSPLLCHSIIVLTTAYDHFYHLVSF